MSCRRRVIAGLLVFGGAALLGGPPVGTAHAQMADPLALPSLLEPDFARGDWKLGSLPLAAAAPDRIVRVDDLHQKFRIGGALVPWLEPYATLKPWMSAQPAPDGQVASTGGLLLDVPVGSFTFTPSIGAGYVPLSPTDPRGSLEVRSQLELGYEFSNDARVALGYSRIEPTGDAADARGGDNVFSFTFRMPFGALLGR